jgi:mannose-binding lectin 2
MFQWALLLTLVLFSRAETLTPINSFSLNSPYISEALQNRWWEFGGDTIVEVNNFVRLTQDLPHQNGWLWSKMVIFLKKNSFLAVLFSVISD